MLSHVSHSIFLRNLLAAGLVIATSCGKDDSKPPSKEQADGKEAAAPETKPEVANDGPFAAFDLPGVAKKWQGSWVVDGGAAAWDVRGDEVTVYDGATEKTLELAVKTPCQVATIARSDGGTSSTIHKFAFDGDTLYAGLGNAGVKKGDAIVACVSNKVFTLEGGKCQAWKESMFHDGKWESEDATCSMSDQDGTQIFEADGTKLELVGEALVDAQMKNNPAKRTGNFEEAKRVLAPSAG
jgi:hypothetical protein